MCKIHWTPINQAKPYAKKVILKTSTSHFIHVMCDKDGKLVAWEDQEDRWTDGKFEYADVTHWAEL